MKEMEKEILNTEKARKLLEMSRTSFYRARKKGQIEASMQIHGRDYYTVEDLSKMIQKPKKQC
jgi:hypothetical protein